MGKRRMYGFLRGMFVCYIAVFTSGFSVIASASESPKAFMDASAVLEAWEINYAHLKSMQVSYTERLLDATPPHLLDRVMYQHVERVEESKSKRYRIRYSTAEDGFAKQENITEHAFDGKITTEYFGGEKLGTIDPGLIGHDTETKNGLKRYMLLDPYPFSSTKYLEEFPNGVPMFVITLRYALSSSAASVRPNLEQVAGQLCHVIEIIFKSEGIREYKVWFAHDKGFLPLRYKHYNKGRLVEEFEVEQIALAETDTGSIWYPVKAQRTQDTKSFGTTKYELTTHAFVPNVKVDKETFRVDFPNGTRVLDKVLGLTYVTGVGDVDGVPLVSDFEPSSTDPAAKEPARTTLGFGETSVEEKVTASTLVTDKEKDKEEGESHVELVTVKDENKILGLKSLSILGVVVVAIFGLLFWYKHSSTT